MVTLDAGRAWEGDYWLITAVQRKGVVSFAPMQNGTATLDTLSLNLFLFKISDFL